MDALKVIAGVYHTPTHKPYAKIAVMSGGSKYLLVALPTYISLANDHDEALTALRSAVTTDYGTTYPFLIPTFKIGSLDALVQQADDLAKLASDCEAVVGRVGDTLENILEGDQSKIADQKNVNDSRFSFSRKRENPTVAADRGLKEPVDQYLQTFSWNKVKFRADKTIGELIESLRKVRMPSSQVYHDMFLIVAIGGRWDGQ